MLSWTFIVNQLEESGKWIFKIRVKCKVSFQIKKTILYVEFYEIVEFIKKKSWKLKKVSSLNSSENFSFWQNVSKLIPPCNIFEYLLSVWNDNPSDKVFKICEFIRIFYWNISVVLNHHLLSMERGKTCTF